MNQEDFFSIEKGPETIFQGNYSEMGQTHENSQSNPSDLLGFDPVNIVQGPPFYVRKQVYYQGWAATTWSIEQATNIIDYIGQKADSEDCLPFAVKLIQNNELISIAEDNGEFGCGNVLSRCLKKLDGFNVLVCVTRRVKGFFVADMVQTQKLHAVKEAGDRALELLHKQLTGSDLRKEEVEVPQSQTPPPPSVEDVKNRLRRKTKR